LQPELMAGLSSWQNYKEQFCLFFGDLGIELCLMLGRRVLHHLSHSASFLFFLTFFSKFYEVAFVIFFLTVVKYVTGFATVNYF
jgi:hypothetical protein